MLNFPRSSELLATSEGTGRGRGRACVRCVREEDMEHGDEASAL